MNVSNIVLCALQKCSIVHYCRYGCYCTNRPTDRMRRRSETQEASSDRWVTANVFRNEPPPRPLPIRPVWDPRRQLAWAYCTIIPILDSIPFISTNDMICVLYCNSIKTSWLILAFLYFNIEQSYSIFKIIIIFLYGNNNNTTKPHVDINM